MIRDRGTGSSITTHEGLIGYLVYITRKLLHKQKIQYPDLARSEDRPSKGNTAAGLVLGNLLCAHLLHCTPNCCHALAKSLPKDLHSTSTQLASVSASLS